MVRTCLVLPLISDTNHELLGILVGGINPRHELDDNYRIFYNLFANNVAFIIANANARKEDRQRAEVCRFRAASME